MPKKTALRWLLIVPLVFITLVGLELAPLLARLALARAPLNVYPQMVMDFVRSTTAPIVGNEVYLGMAIRGMPNVHAVHRNRREALLERYARTNPEESIIAVVVLDQFYTPEEMSRIIDPRQWNVVGFTAFAPSLGPHGLTSGGGLGRTSVNIQDIPRGPLQERAVQRWEDLRETWSEWIDYDLKILNAWRKRLNTIRAGEIPSAGGFVVYRYRQVFLHSDPRIIGMSPQERLKDPYWQYGLVDLESEVQQREQDFMALRDKLQTDKGIYAVIIEGPSAKVNTLRQKAEVVLVDPLLFGGPLGIVSTGRNNPRLRIMFVPTRPNEIMDPR